MKHRSWFSYSTVLILFILAGLLLAACNAPAKPKTYTIGVLNYVATLDSIVEGFKAGMTELGYVEGQNITYIYNGVLQNDPQVLEAEAQALMDQKVDMFLTLGNPTTLAAKKIVEGTGVPVVFSPFSEPVAGGAVESLSRPGGNVTGVQSVNNAPKALEWLVRLVPDAKKVYVFYHPKDESTILIMKPLPEAAAQLGVEFAPAEAASPEQVMSIMETLPEDSAILVVPFPSLSAGTKDIKLKAIELQIPLAGYNDSGDDAIFGFTVDRTSQGEQAARLADQIFKGTQPANLPVETAQSFLRINMKTADALGLDIPNDILKQADTVLR